MTAANHVERDFPADSARTIRVLIGYGSRFGSTREIAVRIADTFRACGADVDVRAVDAITDVVPYDGIVLGSGVYDGSWTAQAIELVRRHAADLTDKPVWLFSVGSFSDRHPVIGGLIKKEPREIAEIAQSVHPREYRVFAGVIDLDRWPRWGRLVFRALGGRAGDNRDWSEIDSWAERVIGQLRSESTGAPLRLQPAGVRPSSSVSARRADPAGDKGGTMSASTVTPHVTEGHVSRGFEAVRDAFEENFTRRHELGGACCVYHHGEKVVDLWGGIRNEITREPWERDTMVVVHSATKGLSAMTLAIAHSRGWLNYDERVSTYWPEFAQHGKEKTTVRQLLAHQAGLFAFDEPVDRRVVQDLDELAAVMARHTPAWEPGTRQAYHGLTLGFYEGELMRRLDPQHRSLGQFFQDEIATRLSEDFYIRLPDEIPNARLATLTPPGMIKMLIEFRPVRLLVEGLNPRSNISRALSANPGTSVYFDESRVYARNLEVPAGGGVGTARAMAHAYGVFASGGHELGLRQETLDLLAAPAIPAARGFYDECLKGEVQFSLGFMKPSANWRFGGARSFGSPGTGGALGFADPDAGIGYGYVTSRMGTVFTGDPRDVALRDALYTALRSRPRQLRPERAAS